MRRLLTGSAAGLVAGPCVGLADAVYVLTSGPPSDYLALAYAVALYGAVGLALGSLCGLAGALLGLAAPASVPLHRVYTGSFATVLAGMGAAVAAQELDRVVYLDQGLPGAVRALLVGAALLVLVLAAWLGPILLTRTPFKIVLRIRGTLALVGALGVLSGVFSLSPVSGGDRTGELRPDRLQDEILRQGPDLLLLLVDSLRPDHLGAYGAPGGRTPALDALAARGIVFEQAVSPSNWTRGAVASLLTGQVPSAHGVRARGDMLDEGALTLPEQLQARGWVTGALFDHPDLVRHHDLTLGFDWTPGLVPRYPLFASPSASRLALYRVARRVRTRRLGVTPGIEEYHQPAHVALDRAREFADANRDRRWFLAVHLMDPNPPLLRAGSEGDVLVWEGGSPPAAGREPEARAAYAEAVARVDTAVGDFLAWLAEDGGSPDALVVLTAPHGLALGEHGGWGAGTSLYDEQVRVPLIVALPGGVRAGTRVAAQVSLVDLAPALTAWGGGAVPVGWQGRDLLAEGLADGVAAVVESGRPGPGSAALRVAGWKLVGPGEPDPAWPARLFDLARDPGEEADLAAAEPSVRERLERDLTAHLQHAAALHDSLDGDPIDAATAERIRSLGYPDE